MNKKIGFLGAALIFSIQSFSLAADSRNRTRRGPQLDEVITTSSAGHTAHGTTVSFSKIGLGMTTLPSVPTTTVPGLSALFDIGEGNSIQTFMNLGYLSGIGFGLGSMFRHDVKVAGDSGFHVGGGVSFSIYQTGLGGVGFSVIGTGVGGFHFPIPGTSNAVSACFDAGLSIGYMGGFVFSFGGLSPALGLSLHYFL